MAKNSRTKDVAEEARRLKTIPLPAQPRGWTPEERRTGQVMPPKGPSNIIVMTPNPLPAPKDVKSQ